MVVYAEYDNFENENFNLVCYVFDSSYFCSHCVEQGFLTFFFIAPLKVEKRFTET